MMLSFTLMAACMAPIIIDTESKEKFGTPNDMHAYGQATLTCINRYNSCMKYFIKKESHRFHVICAKHHVK